MAIELKKYAARQNKDGWIVSFVVHPNDDASEIVTAHVGADFEAEFKVVNEEG